MRPPHLLLAGLLGAAATSAWQVTSWYVESTSLRAMTGDKVYTGTFTTYIQLTASPASPSVSPTSSYTRIDRARDVSYTNYYLPASPFTTPLPTRPAGYEAEQYGRTRWSTNVYLQPRVTSAPDFCSSKWTTTISATVYPPEAVTDQLEPTTSSVRIKSTRAGATRAMTTVYHGLTADAVPWPSTASAGTYYYYYADRSRSCEAPTATPIGALSDNDDDDDDYNDGSFDSSGYYYGDDDYDDDDDASRGPPPGYNDYYRDLYEAYRRNATGVPDSWAAYQWSLPGVRAGVIAAVVLVAVLFLLGFAESYYWFAKLMTGRAAWRGGTWCWALITVWGICLLHRQRARGEDAEERAALERRWGALKTSQKLALWRKWGFRWEYPECELGVQPGRVVVVEPGPDYPPGVSGGHYYPPPPREGGGRRPFIAIIEDIRRGRKEREKESRVGVRETQLAPGAVMQQRGRGSVVLEAVREERVAEGEVLQPPQAAVVRPPLSPGDSDAVPSSSLPPLPDQSSTPAPGPASAGASTTRETST